MGETRKPDFSGYATRANVKCSDGRTIKPEAFQHMDGQEVPLVWGHGHKDINNVLGKAVLHARADGIYADCYTNDTNSGEIAKKIVRHGDVKALSIFANQLLERGAEVLHGNIREVSLVLAGANRGAFIDNVVVTHGDGYDDEVLAEEAVISAGEQPVLAHSDESDEDDEELEDDESDESDDDEDEDDELEHADGDTIKDVIGTMNEEQQDVLYYLVAEAMNKNSDDSAEHGENTEEGDLTHQEGNEDMPRNAFEHNDGANDSSERRGSTLTHDQLSTIIEEGKANGSFKDALLAHADEYGITNIEMLFPDATAVSNKPEWITRRMEWVEKVLGATKKLPYAKIKSWSADLTHEEARAKGYIKANVKKEQFFAIQKRETGPKTIYKKQRLDRDDILDITEFDVVSWLWVEMNFMLREEIARAILVGDGREVDDPDKIDETKIRPVAHDDPFYTDVLVVPANVSGEAMVEAVIRGRENYKGKGQPDAYMTRSVLNDMLLVKDKMGRRLYRNRAELASELEVNEIVLVPVLEDQHTDDGDILMILVNLADYSVGTNKGGEITKFSDFDIDVNQEKLLIEGRMSGALTEHKTAQVVVRQAGTLVDPDVPTFNTSTGVLTVPNETGVVYKNQDTDATLTAGAQSAIAAGASVSVVAVPATGYYFPHNTDADWTFTRDA